MVIVIADAAWIEGDVGAGGVPQRSRATRRDKNSNDLTIPGATSKASKISSAVTKTSVLARTLIEPSASQSITLITADGDDQLLRVTHI